MFVPKKWGHLEKVPFSKYGFTYSCMAQWILVQTAARKFEPFEHFFKMEPEDLPEITEAAHDVIEEGLREMLGASDIIPYLYAHPNRVLGIGINQKKAEFGTPHNGKNLYGRAIRRVLKARQSSK